MEGHQNAVIDSKRSKDQLVLDYLSLRNLIGMLGILLPIILLLGTLIYNDIETVQNSISAYYHTVLRDLFVGLVCAIGVFLFNYKGYEPVDRRVGIIAGVAAFGVALFPTYLESRPEMLISAEAANVIHFISAAIFFISIAYFSIFLFTKSNKKPHEWSDEKHTRNKVYYTCGVIILMCIAIIGAGYLIGWFEEPIAKTYKPVFALEAIALFAFGIAWLVKGEFILADED